MTIDQATLNFLFATLIGGLSGLLSAWAFSVRRRSETKAHVETTEANSDAQLVSAILQLAQGMTKAGEIAAAERQQTLMAIERSSGRIEGMMAAIVDQTKSVKEVGMQIDEFGGRIQHIPQMKDDVGAIRAATASLETSQTNLGDSLKDQLGGILAELTKVTTSISELVAEIQSTSGKTNNNLMTLIDSVKAADKRVMDLLGQFVTDHIKDFLPADSPETNGKPTNDHAQDLPVNILITPASTPKDSKS